MKINYANNTNTTKIKYGIDDLPYIAFDILENTGNLVSGFTTRLGGVSQGFYSSLNLGFKNGDIYENVLENHKILSENLGIDYRDIVTTDQTHTTNIKVVDESDKGKGIVIPRDYSNIDGLITNCKNIPLFTYYADCVPLYFYDPVNKAIGLCHSGWRGTKNRIGKLLLDKMNEQYDTKAKDVIACIGPSICKHCYEVGYDVASEFIDEFSKHKECILECNDNGKYLLDLWKVNEIVLLEAGIDKNNLAVTDICTCCNKEVLFSHRGHNGKRGNMAAFLMMK